VNASAIYWLGPFSAFMSSITWAIGSGRYSKLSKTASPYAINFSRAIFSFPFFLIASVVVAGGITPLLHAYHAVALGQVGWLTASTIASYAFGDAMFLLSAQAIGVPSALAIGSIFPIWTALVAYFFQGQILGAPQIMGLLVAVSGVVVVIMSDITKKGMERPALIERRVLIRGVLLALVTSFMWTLNSYAINRAAEGTAAVVANSVRMLIAIVMVALIARGMGYKGRLLISKSSFRSMIGVFFLETCLGSFFYIYGLCHSSLAVAATLTSLAPVLSVPVAIMLGLERFSFVRTLGICLVVLGLCFLVGGSAAIG
jgi:drug/metabolite transporter (DMT)-like permease